MWNAVTIVSVIGIVISGACAIISVAIAIWQNRRMVAVRQAEAHREKPRLIAPVHLKIGRIRPPACDMDTFNNIERVTLTWAAREAICTSKKNPNIVMPIENVGAAISSIEGELDGERISFWEMESGNAQGFMLVYPYHSAKKGKESTLIIQTQQVSGWRYRQRYHIVYGWWGISLNHTQVLSGEDRSIDF